MAVSYRFGDFKLDPAKRELSRGDAPVAVPPRAFDCIVYLLEHRERAVGRDELIAAVWGRTETGDGTLGQTVLAARRALDDTGKEQHAIRTVFRFGYHWVAPVDVVAAAATNAVESAPPPVTKDASSEPIATTTRSPLPTPAPERRYGNGVRFTVAVIALLLLGALAFVSMRALRNPIVQTTSSPTPSHGIVALVLPVTVNAGSGYDWVRLGLMDLIGARLRSAGLAVVSSDNVVALTSRSTDAFGDAKNLAHATGATLVIEARADSVDARWRVTLRSVLGREPPLTAAGESGDVLAAAREAADQFARALGFTPAQSAPSEDDPLAVNDLSQQIEAAMLSDRLDAARALIASATPAQREQPELRLRLAQIDYQAGDFDTAAAGFEAVAHAASAEQDPVTHARAVSNLGVIAAMRDDPALARRRFDEAIELLRSHHAADALGKALIGRANINGVEDHYDAALGDFAEARAAFESSGNLLALAVLDSNLAAMDMHRYHYAEAEPAFERATDRFATLGVNAAELNALTGAAELKLALLEPDAALAMEPHLRELIAKVADPARKRAGELTRIEVIAAQGRLREASASLQPVLADAAHADDRAALAHAHAMAARLALANGDAQLAASEAGVALQLASVADDAREHARVLRLRVRALLDAGSIDDARVAERALSAFADADGGAPARFYARLAAADCADAANDDSARAAYANALEAADALRIPLDVRDAAEAYATWLARHGDLAGASATAERVAGWSARDFDSALVQLRVQHALGDETLWHGALTRALALAGERSIPADLATAPAH